MIETKKILTSVPVGKLLSMLVMMFLLGFLTVGNAFIYSNNFSVQSSAQANDNDQSNDTSKRPISAEEEKSTSSRGLSNINEEYLHEHDNLQHLSITITSSQHHQMHPHGYGDDHSSLDCPPPDFS